MLGGTQSVAQALSALPAIVLTMALLPLALKLLYCGNAIVGAVQAILAVLMPLLIYA